jgi:Leucine-rich repeat (LRR) protein
MSGNPDHAHSDNSAHKGVLQEIRDGAARSATHIKLLLWRLTSLPPKLVGLKNLTRLDLNGEFLTSLPPGVAQLKNLTTLNLIINRLTSRRLKLSSSRT